MDEREKIIAAYKTCFGSEHGKIVLENLSKFCFGKPESHLFDVNSGRQTDFNLGKNDVLRHIQCMMNQKTEPTQTKVISERKIL